LEEHNLLPLNLKTIQENYGDYSKSELTELNMETLNNIQYQLLKTNIKSDLYEIQLLQQKCTEEIETLVFYYD
jgi:hypothetical protein